MCGVKVLHRAQHDLTRPPAMVTAQKGGGGGERERERSPWSSSGGGVPVYVSALMGVCRGYTARWCRARREGRRGTAGIPQPTTFCSRRWLCPNLPLLLARFPAARSRLPPPVMFWPVGIIVRSLSALFYCIPPKVVWSFFRGIFPSTFPGFCALLFCTNACFSFFLFFFFFLVFSLLHYVLYYIAPST